MTFSSKNSSSSNDEPIAVTDLPDRLQDVTCRIDVVLGTGSVTVRECLALAPQSIVRLSEAAGSELRILINGIAVAEGEIVIMDDATSIRVTEILAPPSADNEAEEAA